MCRVSDWIDASISELTRSFFFLSGVMKPFLAFLAFEASSMRLRTSARLRSISACLAFFAYWRTFLEHPLSYHRKNTVKKFKLLFLLQKKIKKVFWLLTLLHHQPFLMSNLMEQLEKLQFLNKRWTITIGKAVAAIWKIFHVVSRFTFAFVCTILWSEKFQMITNEVYRAWSMQVAGKWAWEWENSASVPKKASIYRHTS